MEPEHDFFPLLVVTLMAVFVPVILHRVLRAPVPIVVGEILAGIAIGSSGLGLIEGESPNLDFLKTFGFAYLMFLAGLEVDFDLLWRGTRSMASSGESTRGRNPVSSALLSFGVTLAVSLVFSWYLVRIGVADDVLLMSLILSTTSLGVVMPVLKERGVLRSALGQHTLVVSVLGDFATVFLISSYVVFRTKGVKLEVLLVLVLLVATFLVYRTAHVFRRRLPLDRWVEELSHATGQLDTRAALALAVVFIALAQGLGVEMILGAFMAGAIVSLLSTEESSDLRLKLNALGYGFFIPIFFIMVGVEFDLAVLVQSPRGVLLVLLLIGMAYGVKFLAALVYRRVFSWREVLALGSLTSARLSLIIAVAAIGVEIEVIDEATNSAVIVVSIFTVIVSPLLFNLLVPKQEERRSRVLVVGSVPHASLLVKRLQASGEDAAVLTRSPVFHGECRELGIESHLYEEGPYADALPELGMDRVKALIALIEKEAEAAEVALAAKERFGVETVIASVKQPELAESLKQDGIQVVEPGLSLVVMLEAMLSHPHVFSMLSERELGRTLRTVTIRSRALNGRKLRDLSLPGDALLLVIVRHGEMITPRGSTRLRLEDSVTVAGSRAAVEEAVSYLGG